MIHFGIRNPFSTQFTHYWVKVIDVPKHKEKIELELYHDNSLAIFSIDFTQRYHNIVEFEIGLLGFCFHVTLYRI